MNSFFKALPWCVLTGIIVIVWTSDRSLPIRTKPEMISHKDLFTISLAIVGIFTHGYLAGRQHNDN